MPRRSKGDGGSAAQKRGPAPLPDAVRDKKKSFTLIAFDRNGDKGESDKNTKTSNKNLAQGNKSTP